MKTTNIRLPAPKGTVFTEKIADELVGQSFPMTFDGEPYLDGKIIAAQLEDDPHFMEVTIEAEDFPPAGYSPLFETLSGSEGDDLKKGVSAGEVLP